jgi:hypothetical protein
MDAVCRHGVERCLIQAYIYQSRLGCVPRCPGAVHSVTEGKISYHWEHHICIGTRLIDSSGSVSDSSMIMDDGLVLKILQSDIPTVSVLAFLGCSSSYFHNNVLADTAGRD